MTGPERDEQYQDAPVAWHNRTSTLLGASAAGLAAIALVIGLISYMVTQGDDPGPIRNNFVEPTSPETSSEIVTPTTTSTITSTSPPITTDINPESTSPSSETSTISTRPPRTRDPDLTTRTTRERPRITRSTPEP